MTVTIKGLKGSVLFLDGIAKGKYMKIPLLKYGHNVRRTTAVYPPQRSSSYKRTGNLGKRWFVKAEPKQVTISNTASYAGWVQSKKFQTGFHKATGWKTVEDESLRHIGTLNKDIDAEIKRLDNATKID